MAVGWSPAGWNSLTIFSAMPPSDFSGRSGRCGVQIWPFLCSGLPDSISRESAATVAVTPEFDSDSASSSEMSRPATGLSPAAARSLADAAPPIEVPRAVLVGAEERSGMRLDDFGFEAPSPGSRRGPANPPGGERRSRAADVVHPLLPVGERWPEGPR